MEMKIHKSSLILFLIFFLADHCFWLVNANVQSLTNEFCWMLIVSMFFCTVFVSDCGKLFNTVFYEFGFLVLFTIVMGGYSTIQAVQLHGQSLMQGILPQRFMISAFLLYFVLMKRINNKKGYLERIESVFLAVGCTEMILYISQYFLINTVRFLNITVSYRLDGIRMNLGAIGIPFVIFNSINTVFKNKKLRVFDVLCIAAGLFYSFSIAKTRITLVAYMLAIIGGYLVWKKGGKRKFWAFFIIAVFIVCLSQTSLYSYLIEGINNIDLSSQTRSLGRAYYLKRIAEHPIFGCGYINTNNANAVAYSGMNSISTGTIAWVDLGVYGLTFFFGLLGFTWFVILYSKMAIKAYKIAKKGNLAYWMYMVYSIVISPNGTGFIWYISSTVAFVVWICLIEGNYKEMNSDITEN